MSEGFLIGPSLREKLRVTIARVDDMPYGDGAIKIPTRFEDIPRPGTRLRRGTFTGSWNIGETKTVMVVGSSETVAVTNYCIPVNGQTNATQTLNVIYGSVMGTASAVEIQQPTSTCTLSIGGLDLTELPNFDATAIQLLGHGASDTASTACFGLQWFSVTQCSTAA